MLRPKTLVLTQSSATSTRLRWDTCIHASIPRHALPTSHPRSVLREGWGGWGGDGRASAAQARARTAAQSYRPEPWQLDRQVHHSGVRSNVGQLSHVHVVERLGPLLYGGGVNRLWHHHAAGGGKAARDGGVRGGGGGTRARAAPHAPHRWLFSRPARYSPCWRATWAVAGSAEAGSSALVAASPRANMRPPLPLTTRCSSTSSARPRAV